MHTHITMGLQSSKPRQLVCFPLCGRGMLFTVLCAPAETPTHTRPLSLLISAAAAVSVGFFLSLSVLMAKIIAKHNRKRKYCHTSHGTVQASNWLVLLSITRINTMLHRKESEKHCKYNQLNWAAVQLPSWKMLEQK